MLQENKGPTLPRDSLELFRSEALQASRGRFGSPVKPVGTASWLLTIFFAGLFCAIGIGVFTAHYTRKESVQGELEPSAGALRVTSPRSGVIRDVYVHEGEYVSEGQPLFSVSLDPVVEGGSTLSQLLRTAGQNQVAALIKQSVAHQSSVQDQRHEIAMKRDSLIDFKNRLATDIELQKKRIQLQRDTLVAMDKLHQKQFLSDVQYRQQQDSLIEAELELSHLERSQEDNSFEINELFDQDKHLRDDARETAAQEDNSRANLDEKFANLSAQAQITIIAPKSGVIDSLQVKPGSSTTNSAALAVIRPKGSLLQAYLWAPSRAAGFVRPGDEVRIRYDAFPFQRFGVGGGRVVEVSKAPIPPNELPIVLDNSHESMYRITVALNRQDIGAYGDKWPLNSGMRLNADLILESRTFLDWLMEPLAAIRGRN